MALPCSIHAQGRIGVRPSLRPLITALVQTKRLPKPANNLDHMGREGTLGRILAMSSHFFFSETLKTSQAKKLCGALMEQPSWRDVMGGSTGVVVNESPIDFKDVPINTVSRIEMREIASFEFSGSCQVDSKEHRSLRLPIGECSSLPDGIGLRNSFVEVHSGEFEGLSLGSKFDNSIWYQGGLARDYPELINFSEVQQIDIVFRLGAKLPPGSSLFAEHSDLLNRELTSISSLIERFGLPCIPYDAYIACMGCRKNCEDNLFPAGTIRCSFNYNPGQESIGVKPYLNYSLLFDSEKLPQWRDAVSQMQQWLIEDSASYRVFSGVDLGRMNWYSGYPQCVTLEAREILRRECENPQYDVYNLSYMELEPETWEVREKRRKKVTEPRFMQLGECELENGCKLTLRLKMLKEGYVVYLDFPTEEDMVRFADTKLFGMTKWQSSSE